MCYGETGFYWIRKYDLASCSDADSCKLIFSYSVKSSISLDGFIFCCSIVKLHFSYDFGFINYFLLFTRIGVVSEH